MSAHWRREPQRSLLRIKSRGRIYHGRFLSVVHSIRVVLAAGVGGIDRLSIYMAVPTAVPACRDRRAWGAGFGVGCDYVASAAVDRSV